MCCRILNEFLDNHCKTHRNYQRTSKCSGIFYCHLIFLDLAYKHFHWAVRIYSNVRIWLRIKSDKEKICINTEDPFLDTGYKLWKKPEKVELMCNLCCYIKESSTETLTRCYAYLATKQIDTIVIRWQYVSIISSAFIQDV